MLYFHLPLNTDDKFERSQPRWFGHLIRTPPEQLLISLSEHKQLGGGFEADLRPAGGIRYPIWPRNAVGSTGRSCKALLCRRMFGIVGLTCCWRDQLPDKGQENGRLEIGTDDRWYRRTSTEVAEAQGGVFHVVIHL